MNRSTTLTQLEKRYYNLTLEGYTQREIATELFVTEIRVSTALARINQKFMYLDILKMYHLPKNLPVKAYNYLCTDWNFMQTKDIDAVDLSKFNMQRFGCNITKIISEGERY